MSKLRKSGRSGVYVGVICSFHLAWACFNPSLVPLPLTSISYYWCLSLLCWKELSRIRWNNKKPCFFLISFSLRFLTMQSHLNVPISHSLEQLGAIVLFESDLVFEFISRLTWLGSIVEQQTICPYHQLWQLFQLSWLKLFAPL